MGKVEEKRPSESPYSELALFVESLIGEASKARQAAPQTQPNLQSGMHVALVEVVEKPAGEFVTCYVGEVGSVSTTYDTEVRVNFKEGWSIEARREEKRGKVQITSVFGRALPVGVLKDSETGKWNFYQVGLNRDIMQNMRRTPPFLPT